MGHAAKGLQYLLLCWNVGCCRTPPMSHATQVFGKPLIEQAVIRENHGNYR